VAEVVAQHLHDLVLMACLNQGLAQASHGAQPLASLKAVAPDTRYALPLLGKLDEPNWLRTLLPPHAASARLLRFLQSAIDLIFS
jgi:hypothetical protein